MLGIRRAIAWYLLARYLLGMCKVVVKKNFAFTISWAPSPPGGEAAAVACICLAFVCTCLEFAWYLLGIGLVFASRSLTKAKPNLSILFPIATSSSYVFGLEVSSMFHYMFSLLSFIERASRSLAQTGFQMMFFRLSFLTLLSACVFKRFLD